MKILLLQDALHLPSHGGGNKANRLLLEALAARGHATAMVSRATNRSVYLTTRGEVDPALSSRGIPIDRRESDVLRYDYRGVSVTAIGGDDEARARRVRACIDSLAPDVLLVSDDRDMRLVSLALEHSPRRTIVLVHTLLHLPFGPWATRVDEVQTACLRAAAGVVTVSHFVQRYLQTWAGLDATALHFPVYGDLPPLDDLPPFNAAGAEYVTLINPCAIKGLPIFLALARCFPDVSFAAVPTWGAEASVLDALRAVPNVRLLPAADDLDEILRQTKILLVPSLIEETFGYVVPEAMLRGVPVLAADVGGLDEARLGVGCLLPVKPVVPGPPGVGGFVVPEQEIGPWRDALDGLLREPLRRQALAQAGREAALAFVSGIDVSPFERLFERVVSA